MKIDTLPTSIDIKRLSKVNLKIFMIKYSVWVFLILLGWGLIATDFLLLKVPGYFIVGFMFVHGVELQHQCLHNTGFKKKQTNRFFGFFLGLPMLVSFSDYQYHHLKHHRLLGTPENKEFFTYGDHDKMTIFSFIVKLFMIGHYIQIFKLIINLFTGHLIQDYPDSVKKKIKTEYSVFLLFIIVFILSLTIFKTTIFLHYWLIPLLVAIPIHALVELPEHVGCNTNNPDVLHNTRTIKSNKFITWFTNGNNFHVEHHWLPGVPMENLEEIHKIIEDKEQFLNITYREFYSQFFRELFQSSINSRK